LVGDPGAKTFEWQGQISQERKKKQKERTIRKGKPVETATALEIDQGGLRQLFLDDFHRCLKKPPHKTLRLFHIYHRLDSG